MTRAGYTEGGTERKTVKAQRGVESLARRPAVLGDAGEIKYIVCKSITGTQTLAPGNSNLLWQVNVNPNPECFTPVLLSGSDYWKLQINEAGVYIVTITVRLFSATVDADWDLSIYTIDPGSGPTVHRSKRSRYDHATGNDDASFDWTFRMSSGSFEIQFMNFGAGNLAGDHAYIECLKWPGTVTMTGRDRDTNPG